MTDLRQELWDWQEKIDSPVAAKLLLVRAIQRMTEDDARIKALEGALEKIANPVTHFDSDECIALDWRDISKAQTHVAREALAKDGDQP